MDTAEERQEASESPTAGVYDGFMSYSHAADDLLAPRLQAGLQRFAKPWWKRRALRVFRDEASLSANPHLWSSIAEALDQSDWFVLLLSPDAAESPWVNREVEYWLEHKDSDRIIPVVTDGDFAWADGDIVSDAAPPALQGAFSNEPRWVDLRFAHSEEQLDLKNPHFSAAVADVASAVRGVPKDELESEEVRQHRRTIRTAWAAGIALTLLLILATAAAVFAVGQRNEAQTQQAAAEAAAEAEGEQRAEAEARRAEAEEAQAAEEEQRARADEQARISNVRALSAASVANLDVDPELSVLLALQAVDRSGAEVLPEAEEALHRAVQAHRLQEQVPAGAAAFFSPDGARFIGGGPGDVPVWDVATGEEILTLVGHTEAVFNAVYRPDGAFIATNSFDGSTRLWNAATSSQVGEERGRGSRRARGRDRTGPASPDA